MLLGVSVEKPYSQKSLACCSCTFAPVPQVPVRVNALGACFCALAVHTDPLRHSLCVLHLLSTNAASLAATPGRLPAAMCLLSSVPACSMQAVADTDLHANTMLLTGLDHPAVRIRNLPGAWPTTYIPNPATCTLPRGRGIHFAIVIVSFLSIHPIIYIANNILANVTVTVARKDLSVCIDNVSVAPNPTTQPSRRHCLSQRAEGFARCTESVGPRRSAGD